MMNTTQPPCTLGELAQTYIDRKDSAIRPGSPLSNIFTYARENFPCFIETHQPLCLGREPDEHGMFYNFDFARNKAFDFTTLTSYIQKLAEQEKIDPLLVALDTTKKQRDRQRLSIVIRNKEDRERFALFIRGLSILLRASTQKPSDGVWENGPGLSL